VNRTAKILLAAGCIVVLSYPAAAWVTGIAIESRIQHNEQEILDRAPYLALVKREYHRGIYRSTETAVYGLRNRRLSSATITVVSDIQHGPLPGLRMPALGLVDTRIAAPPGLQKEIAAVLGSKPILEVRTSVGLLGGSASNLTSPAFSTRLPDGSTLAWGGLTGTIATTGNQGRMSGELSVPRLAVQGAKGGVELTGLEYSGTHTKALDDLYDGTMRLTIEKLAGTNPRSGAPYSLERVSIASTAKTTGEFVDIGVDTSADAATFGDVALENVAYSVSLQHVHGPTLAALGQAVRALQRQPGTDPMQVRAGMKTTFGRYGGDLLLREPVIDIRKVSFAMPEGALLFSARISAPGLSPGDLKWPAAILALRAHAQVTADLRIDNGLLQKLLAMRGPDPQITARLRSLEQQGYLTATADAVSTHLEYSAGGLTLNGHPFPPAPGN
jgi:uncharacterized protein YdgA (DUF945 family)